MSEGDWRIRLAPSAEQDLENILGWTATHFGEEQEETYRETLKQAILALEAGPDPVGARRRDEIMPGVRTLHVARQGRRGRHLLLYRVVDERIIEIGRILHDAMEVGRHAPFRPDDDEPATQE